MTTSTGMTAEELLRMPDDGYRYELVRGDLVKMARAGEERGYLATEFGSRLADYVRTHKLGRVYAVETGFRLASDPDTVRAPDVAFVSRQRIEEVRPGRGYRAGAPDLAVEVISSSDAFSDVEDKVLDSLDAGCLMVVVVDPRRETATVYRSRTEIAILTRDERLDGGEVVPGWSLNLQELFS
jgi:Uma2 family endonuclease